MSRLMEAIAILRPGVDCADTNGKLSGIRWDDPCEPPTQEEVDAAIAQLNAPPTIEQKLAAIGLSLEELKAHLGA